MLNGIENPLVVFIGCCQGLIPHSVAKSWVYNAAFLEHEFIPLTSNVGYIGW